MLFYPVLEPAPFISTLHVVRILLDLLALVDERLSELRKKGPEATGIDFGSYLLQWLLASTSKSSELPV